MDKENKILLDKCFNEAFNEPEPPNNAVVVFNKGNSCLIVDDGCYVICNYVSNNWVQSTHIFKESLAYLLRLPVNPIDAQNALRKHGKI